MEDRARPEAWRATIVTLFPELFPGPLGASLTGKALKDGLWSLDTLDIRRFGEGRHRVVDDTPAGGGAGMVMRADILAQALDAARVPGDTRRLIYLSPRGRPFTQALAAAWAAEPGLVLLCGRYEGVDQRVIDGRELEEVSLGDFVLSGGEIAAMALIDAVLRLRPGVLGNAASAVDESFVRGLLEHPQYTRPQVWEGRAIPEVLLSGDHARIARWRRDEAERLTRERRPDLWRAQARLQADPEQSDAHNAGQEAGHEED
ncbi:MAG: tRNA (guanosine(37)-N1)-methyltransferase TrmD [Pseudomonadota bacterium]